MRWVAGFAVVALLGGCSGGSGGGSGSAGSCAGPQVSVSPGSVAAGASVRVVGRYFLDGCNDTGQDEWVPPMKDLVVRFAPAGGTAVELGRVDAAGELGVFDVPLTVPEGTTPGTAHVTVGDARPVELTVS